ncbi:MAG: hypothetical protein IJZ57_02440 [Clostridia bacterium]|nr:hypothetical protein [Clostridia bacterium]
MNNVFDTLNILKERYNAEEVSVNNSAFSSFGYIKIKKFLFSESFYVASTDLDFSKESVKKVCDAFDAYLNESGKDGQSLLCIFNKGTVKEKADYTYFFNGNNFSFVHPYIVLPNENKTYFDKDFSYAGGKCIKKFVNEFEDLLSKK